MDLSNDFRGAMRRLQSGVAIITSNHNGTDFGIVISALMSLSMDPPSLLVSLNKSASITNPLLEARKFCLNLLSEEQKDFCNLFSKTSFENRFSDKAWQKNEDGIMFLPNSQAIIFCQAAANMEYETHNIIVGNVDKILLKEEIAPLSYVDGRYVGAKPLEMQN
ncbi:MAG: flavin reductase [Caulobacterales bacterium]|nr:flavin reductase [Caulobacterales bacterium]